jgi:hypothetical protein
MRGMGASSSVLGFRHLLPSQEHGGELRNAGVPHTGLPSRVNCTKLSPCLGSHWVGRRSPDRG